MSSSIDSIPVRSYSCYRTYLRDFVEFKRQQNRRCTVRRLSLKAGLKTENYLARIIRGQRNMTPKLAEKFIPVFALNGDDATYFLALVGIETARTDVERCRYVVVAERLRYEVATVLVDNAILRHWYLGAIWELASCKNADLTPQGIVRSLRKRITCAQAANALDFLKNKGFLLAKDGRVVPAHRPIYTTDGKPDPVIRLNHKQMLLAAHEAVDTAIEERIFMGLTIAINRRRVGEIRQRVREFVLDLRRQFESDPDADAVYRIGLHSFPLATVEKGPMA